MSNQLAHLTINTCTESNLDTPSILNSFAEGRAQHIHAKEQLDQRSPGKVLARVLSAMCIEGSNQDAIKCQLTATCVT
eukprot:m.90779 g.90779  ORF g.90779 m.90779 type:complete len:78 (+) comp12926_c0_seq3:139-372(+)